MNPSTFSAPHIHIRKRSPRNTPTLIQILRKNFPRWYLRLPYLFSDSLIAEHNGLTIGFVSMPMRTCTGEIGLIAVDSSSREHGIGKILLESALEKMRFRGMKRCVAKVRLDNPPAQRLFASQGFKIVQLSTRHLK